MKFLKIYAAFLGFSSVILGAFGAHYLKKILQEAHFQSFETAVKYQMYMALALLWFTHSNTYSQNIARLWAFGVTLFSGSIYGLIFLEWKFLGPITPFGGFCIILGWFLLILKFLSKQS
jgi:uncharacterized membrane protein YgdD (TMEM256/DUF423 family)